MDHVSKDPFSPVPTAIEYSRMGKTQGRSHVPDDKQNMTYDAVVIGGGAAGIFAAGRAAEAGSRVLLLERNRRLGKKLSITGNGRCNLTNTGETRDFIENFGANGKFLYRALAEFSNRDLVGFFHQLGIRTREEEDGRIFPAGGGSEGVVNALERYIGRHKVAVRLNSRVSRISINPASRIVAGVEIGNDGPAIKAHNVILATGGLSYPRTGSTGDGYRMAKELGHTIVRLRPALVPLETVEEFPRELQGLSLHDVTVTVLGDKRKIASKVGDLLFTHFGVSGPVILELSGCIVEHLDRNETVAISICLVPDGDTKAKLENGLMRQFTDAGSRSMRTFMRSSLPKALISVVLNLSGIPEEKKCSQITGGERRRLAGILMGLRLTVKGARPIAEAIITRGGIDLKEIDPYTMESKKVKGLFFCGEIMDIDGSTGGYNLQAAFSTAYLAAKGISPSASR